MLNMRASVGEIIKREDRGERPEDHLRTSTTKEMAGVKRESRRGEGGEGVEDRTQNEEGGLKRLKHFL